MAHPHPWRALRALADWTVVIRPLPPGLLGYTDHQTRTIHLRAGMSQAQRRATLAHELQHVERGPVLRHLVDIDEAQVDEATARHLIPLESLLSAVRWCHQWNVAELADELWVDQATVRTRLAHLHPAERHAITRAVRSREGDRYDDEGNEFHAG